MTNDLTMDAWDQFTNLLIEAQLKALLNEIYKHTKLATANANEMKMIIQESTIRWISNNPNEQTELVEGIVKSIDYWNIKKGNRNPFPQVE